MSKQSCVPLMLMEHNFHGGIEARLSTPLFTDYPQVVLHFPPLRFDTHDLGHIERRWTMIVKQKSAQSRPHVKFINQTNFGFRLRLPGGVYKTMEDVFNGLKKVVRVETDDHGMLHTSVVHSKERIVVQDVVKDAFFECLKAAGGDAAEAKLALARMVVDGAFPEFDYESILRAHNERTLENLGDFRAGKQTLPMKVIDLKQFIKKSRKIANDLDIEKLIGGLK